jgi:hypothetical protein
VQFYRPADAPAPDEDTLVELGAQIERVYSDAELVTTP